MNIGPKDGPQVEPENNAKMSSSSRITCAPALLAQRG